VIASDISPYRLELAKKMNADAVIDPSKENFVERVRELTDGRMLDGVLEMSGQPSAIRDGLAALRMGGRLSLLGLPREAFGLDWNQLLIFKGITIHGIIGRRMYQTLVPDGRPAALGAPRPASGDHARDADGAGRRGDRAAAVGQAGKVVLVPWGQNA
jgi:threonine 3-dehydrogenase